MLFFSQFCFSMDEKPEKVIEEKKLKTISLTQREENLKSKDGEDSNKNLIRNTKLNSRQRRKEKNKELEKDIAEKPPPLIEASRAVTVRDTDKGKVIELVDGPEPTEKNRFITLDNRPRKLKEEDDEHMEQLPESSNPGHIGQTKEKSVVSEKVQEKIKKIKEKQLLLNAIKDAQAEREKMEREAGMQSTSTSSSSGSSGEANLINTFLNDLSRGSALSQTNLSPIEANLLLERNEKIIYTQVNVYLESMHNILKEIENFGNELEIKENTWLITKNEQFRELHNNGNLNEKEKEIIKLIEKYDHLNEKYQKETEKYSKLIHEYVNKMKTNKKINEIKYMGIADKTKRDMDKFEKQIVKCKKSLREYYKMKSNIEILKLEKEEMEILKQMKKPLNELWLGYDNVNLTLKKYWKIENIRNIFRPLRYFYYGGLYGLSLKSNKNDERNDYYTTMKNLLEKMLTFRINGQLINEKLNCFDKLSEKMKLFAVEEGKKIEFLQAEHIVEESKKPEYLRVKIMENLGKFFKNELNEKLRDAFNFFIVGLDDVPEVYDELVLNGIDRLSEFWLPQNLRIRFDEIYVQLYEYYEKENANLKFLIENDKLAVEIFDLISDKEYVEEGIRTNQLSKNKKLKKKLGKNAIDQIKNWMQSINMLLKIEKREKDAKPLPFMKSVYEKYWYMIYMKRFKVEENIMEINAEFAGILDEVMKNIKMVVETFKIKERANKYEVDKEFIVSIAYKNTKKENINKNTYEMKKKKLKEYEEEDANE